MDTLLASGSTTFFPSCGAEDSEANAFWKVPLIAARYGAGPEETYLRKVSEAVRTHQNTEKSEKFALAYSRMLRAALHGANLVQAVEAAREGAPDFVLEALNKGISGRITSVGAAGDDIMQAYLNTLASDYLFQDGMKPEMKPYLAKSCSLPASFIVSVKVILDTATLQQHKGQDFDAFKFALRRNMMIGGDQCGRTAFIAGLVAACGAPVPQEWVSKTKVYSHVSKLASALATAGCL
jgi:hypothetical protein